MRYSEEQIIGILRVQEAGVVTSEVCRRHGISDATFYKIGVETSRRCRTCREKWR